MAIESIHSFPGETINVIDGQFVSEHLSVEHSNANPNQTSMVEIACPRQRFVITKIVITISITTSCHSQRSGSQQTGRRGRSSFPRIFIYLSLFIHFLWFILNNFIIISFLFIFYLFIIIIFIINHFWFFLKFQFIFNDWWLAMEFN